ncbi:MAG: hypothetical protein KDF54_10260 [Hydrogenophaga sp.]|nr:hypothetical protein [Hydrogenophaga sp.]
MDIGSFDDLLAAARAAFEKGPGGVLQPLRCVDKSPEAPIRHGVEAIRLRLIQNFIPFAPQGRAVRLD